MGNKNLHRRLCKLEEAAERAAQAQREYVVQDKISPEDAEREYNETVMGARDSAHCGDWSGLTAHEAAERYFEMVRQPLPIRPTGKTRG